MNAPTTDMRDAIDVLNEAKRELLAQRMRILKLEDALVCMLIKHDEIASDSEGRYPAPHAGCAECTVGTVPNRLNTGLCAYHRAKELLAESL